MQQYLDEVSQILTQVNYILSLSYMLQQFLEKLSQNLTHKNTYQEKNIATIFGSRKGTDTVRSLLAGQQDQRESVLTLLETIGKVFGFAGRPRGF